MAKLERPYMLRVRMTEDERQALEALALRQGLTSSDIVRQLVRERAAQVEAEPNRPKR
jgi:predicted DNA-binding protein